MPRRRQVNAEQAAIDEISQEIDRMVDSLGVSEGPAAGANAVSDATLLRQWGQRDPKILDPDGLKEHLMQSGLPQEMLDPNNPGALAMLKANPDLAQDWASVLSSPLDQKMADLVTPLLEHPLRLGMLRRYEDDPKQLVKFSDDMDAKWLRSLGLSSQDTPSAPVPAPPTPTSPAPPVPQPAPSPLGMMGG